MTHITRILRAAPSLRRVTILLFAVSQLTAGLGLGCAVTAYALGVSDTAFLLPVMGAATVLALVSAVLLQRSATELARFDSDETDF